MRGTIGIVVGEDEFTHERKAYIHIVSGGNQKADEQDIMDNGSPIYSAVLEEIIKTMVKK